MELRQTVQAGRLHARLLWLTVLRVVAAFLVLGAVLLQKIGGRQLFQRDPTEAYYVILAACILSVAYLVAFRWICNDRDHATFQIGMDVVFESLLVYFTGGVDSIFAYLFFASILAAALLSSTRMAVLLASLATILLSSVTIIYFYSGLEGIRLPYFAVPNVPSESIHHGNLNFVLTYLFFFALSLHLVAFLSGRLAAELGRVRIVNDEILDNIAGGVLAVDVNGIIAFINTQAKRMFAVPGDEKWSGRHVEELFRRVMAPAPGRSAEGRADAGATPAPGRPAPGPETLDSASADGQGSWRSLLDALVSGTPADWGIEVTGRDGKSMPVEIVTTLLQDAEGQPRGTIAFLHDVSLKRDIIKARAHIESLRLVGRFAAGMAHELRTPLAAVRGCVQELSENHAPTSEMGRKLLEIVLKESSRLNRIVTDFVEFTRDRPIDRVETDLHGLVEEVVILMKRGDLGRDANIAVEIPDGLRAWIDPEQMKQVLVNLIQNALESLPGKPGRVAVRGRMQAAGAEDGQKKVLIEVADTGRGIQPEEMEDIFEPFFSTKPAGTGMGLAIAQRICETHGGDIEARSTPGGETVFTITLPALEA
ncbi:MAG: ATP-binding protein [Planctomycetota bacterium]|nr:ATP-binding protein [Planctomycetota bacterium]